MFRWCIFILLLLLYVVTYCTVSMHDVGNCNMGRLLCRVGEMSGCFAMPGERPPWICSSKYCRIMTAPCELSYIMQERRKVMCLRQQNEITESRLECEVKRFVQRFWTWMVGPKKLL